MSRTHDPTIGDAVREMKATVARLDLDLGDTAVTGDAFVFAYVRALRIRRWALRENLRALADRLTIFGPDASLLTLRVATDLELADVEGALLAAGAPFEADDD